MLQSFSFRLTRLAHLGMAACCFLVADAMAAPPDASEWLAKIVKSARDLPYQGIFLHQTAESTAISHIAHRYEQGVETEKIESINGPKMEMVRRNDELICYQPAAKLARVERRAAGRFFPSLVTGDPKAIAELYKLKLGPVERIAGFDCQWLILEPRDSMRYLQQLCAELDSGLLLGARTINERGVLTEQFLFTQLDLTHPVSREATRSRYEQVAGWIREEPVAAAPQNTESHWKIGNLPAGFRKVMEMVRSLAGRPKPVTHLVYSDGLSNVSIFAEPAVGAARISAFGSSDEAPATYAIRSIADYHVTVLGEVPLTTVQTIADGITRPLR